MTEHTIKKLLECGFEEISEKDIVDYIGIKGVSLKSFEVERISDFGYLSTSNYCIIKTNRNINDAVLRYKDGSSNFIIKYNNKLFMGNWSEGEYIINDPDDDYWGDNSEVFDEFKKEMIKNNIIFYYCDNF